LFPTHVQAIALLTHVQHMFLAAWPIAPITAVQATVFQAPTAYLMQALLVAHTASRAMEFNRYTAYPTTPDQTVMDMELPPTLDLAAMAMEQAATLDQTPTTVFQAILALTATLLLITTMAQYVPFTTPPTPHIALPLNMATPHVTARPVSLDIFALYSLQAT